MVKRDMATLGRIIAKEWTCVVDGQVTTRAAVVADVKSRASKESFSYETLKVHVYGDTAVATGITVTKETSCDPPSYVAQDFPGLSLSKAVLRSLIPPRPCG